MVQRIALVLEFQGSHYHGWQRQENAASIQGVVEQALMEMEQVLRPIVAAGRTDAGVHGQAMVAHADVDFQRWQRSPRAYLHGLNAHLPDDVKVVGVKAVDADFHARFQCVERSYRYQIWNRSTASALHRWQHWWMPRPLNVEAMQQAAQLLLGEHDFSSFRAAHCQAASPIKILKQLDVRIGDDWQIMLDVRANAFLYHMVRNLVGALVQVGLARWSVEEIAQVLAAKSRNHTAPTAPAHGLYFTNARYSDWCARDVVGVAV
ncbi:MAG: tRNA pseudouridine(38-40) synthase TruA [Zetaproteobacteria bacterium]|nr:tRNA pseudouridine(38-40) synthase TruA [Zetaproteobacteria bacterium]